MRAGATPESMRHVRYVTFHLRTESIVENEMSNLRAKDTRDRASHRTFTQCHTKRWITVCKMVATIQLELRSRSIAKVKK